MNIEYVENCPVTGRKGVPKYREIVDRYFGANGTWTYLRDAVSGHMWLYNKPSDGDFQSIYSDYYTHGAASRGRMSIKALATEYAICRLLNTELRYSPSLLAMMLSFLPVISASAKMDLMQLGLGNSKKLLDIGCGDGAFLLRMNSLGWSVWGTEPDTDAGAHKINNAGVCIESNLNKLIEKNLSFDAITLGHVIEHAADPISLLKQLVPLLKVDGKIIITTPNGASISANIFGKNWRGLEPPRHFNIFTPSSLRVALRRAGYRVNAVSTSTRQSGSSFAFSLLACLGKRNIVQNGTRISKATAVLGFVYQNMMHGLIRLLPFSGDEIVCEACLTQT